MGANYFTHDKSYYPVQQTRMEFVNINSMQPLLSEEIIPDTETAMKGKGQFGEKQQRTNQGLYHWQSTRRNKIVIEWT